MHSRYIAVSKASVIRVGAPNFGGTSNLTHTHITLRMNMEPNKPSVEEPPVEIGPLFQFHGSLEYAGSCAEPQSG